MRTAQAPTEGNLSMLIATWYTPSHADMAQRFVIDRYKEAGFDECLFHIAKQTCETATFKQPGWNKCTADKLAWLSGMPADGEPMLFVDADVAIFRGLAGCCRIILGERGLNGLGERLLLQDDYVQLCSGVMTFRRTQRMIDFFNLWYQWCVFTRENDQDGLSVLQHVRKQIGCDEYLVKPTAVVSELFANWRGLGFTKPWQGEPIDPPEAMVLWHANWCIGVEAKTKMLEQVVATHEARAAA